MSKRLHSFLGVCPNLYIAIFVMLSMFYFIFLSMDTNVGAYANEQDTSIAVIIGDSHAVGHFGDILEKELKQKWQNVSRFVKSGTKVSYFIKGDKFKKFISETSKKGKIDAVFIVLGTNYITGRNIENRAKDIRRLLSQLPNESLCVWIGPPKSFRERIETKKISDVLQSEVSARCIYVDSTPCTWWIERENVKDGIHYSKKGAESWVDCVLQKLEDKEIEKY